MRIAYVFRHAPAYIRSTKEINSLVMAGHEVTFIGWDIEPENAKPHDMRSEVRLAVLSRSGVWGKQDVPGWLQWWWHLFTHLFRGKFDVVHAVDEVAALMVLPFKFWLYRHLILDVYDSVIKRPTRTHLGAKILALLRILANSGADRIIETSDELKTTLGRHQDKAEVLFNSPSDPVEFIKGIFPEPGNPIRVAATGAIHSGSMALECLVQALDLCPAGSVEVFCSGWLKDDFAKNNFAKHPAVKYRWIEKQDDYYRMLASCDWVFNMRVDASNSHYRSLVFPNKVFDALAVGRPVIVASENWVAQWVRRTGTGIDCSFSDPKTLRDLILSGLDRRRSLPEFSARSRDLFTKHYSWELMEERLLRLYSCLEPVSARKR